MSDNMDRGNYDYYDKSLAIEPYMDVENIPRGDVVFLKNENGEKDISRVVALPGEKIKISKGQIFINGQRLDTFYGIAHRAGLDKESYFEKMDEAGIEYSKEESTETFETNMEELKLSDNEYYIIGDDWFRGKMTVLTEDKLIGKVIGYIN